MSTIGTVESLWRYPVKSMSGEALTKAFMGNDYLGDILIEEEKTSLCV